MARAIGLDIGTHAVRAADVRLGATPELVAFGQVGLAREAVQHGEIIDPGIVAAAIRRLWRETRIRDRRVRVGLANLRTIVRQVEMPAMGDEELRSALEFQAGDFIPLPPEETVLDFQVLEHFESDDGEAMARVLIAAVHRDTLEAALTAVREAGLQTVALDLVPFALVRALSSPPLPGLETESGAQAIVSIGAGVTVVVVHEAGVPRFVRIVDSGGDDLTEGIAAGLSVTFEEAEALKRRLAAGVDRGAEARAAMDAALGAVVGEVRGSIDFYSSQAGAQPMGGVAVTGGGALTPGLLERLEGVLTAPISIADPFELVRAGDIGFLPEELPALAPYLPVPVGLALGSGPGARYPINLLPAAERRVFNTARFMLVAGGAGLAVMAGLFSLTQQRNADVEAERARLEDQQAANQQLQQRIQGFEGATDVEAEADLGAGRIAGALGTEVSWSRLLHEIGRVIPGDVWLEGLEATTATQQATGGRGAQAQAQTAPAATDINGTVSFTAVAVDYPGVAAWLQRLATLPSLSVPWVNEAGEADVTILDSEFTFRDFSSTARLGESARSDRSRRARAAAPPPAPPAATPGTETTTTTAAAGAG
ncbi:MAG: type IV pilus assembly protein PilM [Actinobacteria bacterium]|nr:type IV pilus assembly protein PilM [Actinomycetota bacterium]